MTLNMSLADIIVSFIIGTIGSALIIIANDKIIGLQRKSADWWARRSIYSIEKRLSKIDKEINFFKEINLDFKKLYSCAEEIKSNIKMRLFTAIFMLILGGLVVSLTSGLNFVGRSYLSSKGEIFIEKDFLTYSKYAILAYFAASTYYAINAFIMHSKLRRILQAERTINQLISSSENLKRRIS